MAIAFGAITGAANSGTSLTFSSPDVSGSNTIGIVVFTRDGVSSSPVSGITWDGQAMTKIDEQYNNFGGFGFTGVDLWYIINPTPGVSNIVVSASNGSNRAMAAFYTGVAQTGQPDASNKGSITSSTNFALAVTSVADNCWSIFVARDVNGEQLAAVTNSTKRTPASNNAIGFFDSNADITPAGSFTMTIKTGNNQTNPKNGIIISIAPFTLPPAEFAIAGVVTLNSAPVEGAIIRCIRQSDNVAIAQQTTGSTGEYLFDELEELELYHLAVEYESGETKYNALSLWDVAPYEVE